LPGDRDRAIRPGAELAAVARAAARRRSHGFHCSINLARQEVWSNPEVCMYMSSPVLDGDYLFGMSDKRKGQFFCLNAATRKVAWVTEGREGSNAAIVSAEGVLFILTDDAKLIAARKNASRFELIKTYLVSDSQTLAHPVVSGRQIIIKDSEGLALWSLD